MVVLIVSQQSYTSVVLLSTSFLRLVLCSGEERTAGSRQQATGSRQQTADSRQQIADSRQQTADSYLSTSSFRLVLCSGFSILRGSLLL
jgi:hypothetical protein